MRRDWATKLAACAFAVLALAIIYQVFFRYSYSYVDNPPLFGGVLRIDHLTGKACVSWGFAAPRYTCSGKLVNP